MKKLYDFYCSVEAIHQDSREFRTVWRLVDGKTYHECVETGQKPASKWGDLVMVAQAVDMTHVTINGVKQDGEDEYLDAMTISDLRRELESVQEENKTLRRQIADMLQKGVVKS